VTGHLHAAHDRAGEKTLTNRSAATMQPFAPCVESPPAIRWRSQHFKAAALHNTNRVNEIAGRKQCRANDVARLHIFGEITKFFDAFDRRAICFLMWPSNGFVRRCSF